MKTTPTQTKPPKRRFSLLCHTTGNILPHGYHHARAFQIVDALLSRDFAVSLIPYTPEADQPPFRACLAPQPDDPDPWRRKQWQTLCN